MIYHQSEACNALVKQTPFRIFTTRMKKVCLLFCVTLPNEGEVLYMKIYMHYHKNEQYFSLQNVSLIEDGFALSFQLLF